MARTTADEPATDRSAANIAIVREVTAALEAGDLLPVMARVSRNVRWAVNAADRDAAPWFRVYQGKRDLPAFFTELAAVEFNEFTLKRIVADDDIVVTWLHVAFTTQTGGSVDMDEVQVWELADGKITAVTTMLDTAAVAAAFPGDVADPVPLALVHDYLTQRGGAERVVLALADDRPDAPIHTSLYDPRGTFPGFADHDVRPTALDRVPGLRHHHRAAFPVLAPTFSRLVVDAEVAICSSSGWAHGARVTGRKIVYCHTPARWLYQGDRYLAGRAAWAPRLLDALAPPLRRWDIRAAGTAHRYVVNARVVRARVADVYGIDAEVVPPPVDLDVDGPTEAVPGVGPGAYLCVSRLLAYKNVDAVIEAFRDLPGERLVVVGAGPLADQLAAVAPANVTMAGQVTDAQLRGLYTGCAGLVAASYEDFGLTPVEAAAFGRPTVALEWGGFLDTIIDGTTGLYFSEPTPAAIADAVRRAASVPWDGDRLRQHAEGYSTVRFTARMASVVAEERARL